MHDAHGMRHFEHREHGPGDLDHLAEGARLATLHGRANRLAFEQLHYEKREAFFGGSVVEDTHDRGVADAVGDVGLAAKSLEILRVFELIGVSYLDRETTAGAMCRGVHRSTASDAEQLVDLPLAHEHGALARAEDRVRIETVEPVRGLHR